LKNYLLGSKKGRILFPNDDSVIHLEPCNARFNYSKHGSTRHRSAGYSKNAAHTIWNLALLQADKNSDARKPFILEKKKNTGKKSSFLLTAQIAELGKWDTVAMENTAKNSQQN
jgi:hypothetical protein